MEKQQKILCNKCGKELESINGILHEDGLFVTKKWGYFSAKDLKIHRFNLCEACYDQMVGEFVVPVTVEDQEEVLD